MLTLEDKHGQPVFEVIQITLVCGTLRKHALACAEALLHA